MPKLTTLPDVERRVALGDYSTIGSFIVDIRRLLAGIRCYGHFAAASKVRPRSLSRPAALFGRHRRTDPWSLSTAQDLERFEMAQREIDQLILSRHELKTTTPERHPRRRAGGPEHV